MKFFTSQDYFSYTGDKKKIVRQAFIMGWLSTLWDIVLQMEISSKVLVFYYLIYLQDIFQKRYKVTPKIYKNLYYYTHHILSTTTTNLFLLYMHVCYHYVYYMYVLLIIPTLPSFQNTLGHNKRVL